MENEQYTARRAYVVLKACAKFSDVPCLILLPDIFAEVWVALRDN